MVERYQVAVQYKSDNFVVKYIIVLDIVGLELGHLESNLLPNVSDIAAQGEAAKMAPVFPALTCPVQSSILSGKYPSQHGIIANGLYDRTKYEVSFWEQSSNLVQTDRIWDIAKKTNKSSCSSSSSSSSSSVDLSLSSLKTAVLFWQNTMYAKADVIVTPRPLHFDDGMQMWCYSKPIGFYDNQLKQKLGEFNLSSYWGPFASSKSSEWICNAAKYTLENERPNLMFIYIPHVDYSAQRFGKGSKQVQEDLKNADYIVGDIVDKTALLGIKDETQFIILSEYGFNDVDAAIPLNLRLREDNLLITRTINDKEYIDYEYSKAFAMVDHQIAHIYVNEGFVDEAKKVLEDTQGVDRILSSQEKRNLNIDHERSGELIAISDRDKWFSYYWWHCSDKAPSFARTVDIHRKPGYDPVELFIDPQTKSIPFDTSLVKSSHGRPADPSTEEGYSLYVSNRKSCSISTNNPEHRKSNAIDCVRIGQYLINLVSA
jgi:predicted AlkP superfamily pyrophosphatase or phosphodiesterase